MGADPATLEAALAAVADVVFRVGNDGRVIEDPALATVQAPKPGKTVYNRAFQEGIR